MSEEWLVISAIMGVISAFITSAIFQSKGRSGWSGFALGFFLGIIGIVIALLIQPDQEKLNQHKFDHGEIAQCPYCKEFIKVDATVCKHCHQPLPPGTAIRRSTPRLYAAKKELLVGGAMLFILVGGTTLFLLLVFGIIALLSR